jgi:hypothetical protein
MAQLFQVDARATSAAIQLTGVNETDGPATVEIPPPFGNCKSSIHTEALVTMGSDQTGIRVRVYRNRSGENTLVGDSGVLSAAVSSTRSVSFACVDKVPDGRGVAYTATYTQSGGVNNGSLLAGSWIRADVLSG